MNFIDDETNRRRGIAMDILPKYSEVSLDDEGKTKEKPGHNVQNEMARKRIHLYETINPIPSPYIVLLLGVYLLLGYLTQLVEDDMPTPLKDSDISNVIDRTSEESSWRYLYEIMGDQPRVCGTQYHLNKTRDMKEIVDRIAATATINVRTDWQIVTGDYFLKSGAPFASYYDRASNIIAVLEGESGFHDNGTINSSVLVNCHYDSVPYALGASDNVIFCAAMAETLDKLSKRSKKLKHNIIFLFNGAEENPMQGSHAFLHHPWSRGVTTLINLDSAGMNGKATIFQVTDPRVLSAYKKGVSRPSAQGLGEFLFTSGVIPSDTDFRIFRDFGDIHGVDIAFTKWGNVYHTRFDSPELIHSGVIQWAGDMVLSLLINLADMNEIGEKATRTSAVYYDYLNWFIVSYSLAMSYVVDTMICLIAIFNIVYYLFLVGARKSIIRELLFSIGGRLSAMLGGIITAGLCTLLMVATTIQLRYLSNPWIVVAVYWIPYLVGSITVSHLYDAWRTTKTGLNVSIRTLQSAAATRIIQSVVLALLMCAPVLTSTRYLIGTPLLITSVTSLVTLTAVRYVHLRAYYHLLLELLLSLPVVMFSMSLSLRLNAMIIPIMARSASELPDYNIAIINIAFAVIVCSAVSGIELLFSKRRLWLPLAVVSIISVVLMFVPFEPYSVQVPSVQRHYWFHTQTTTYNIDNVQTDSVSGVFVSRQDAYTTQRVLQALDNKVINLTTRTDFEEDCQKYVYCNLPLYRTSFGRNLARGLFISMSGPTEFTPPSSLSMDERVCNQDTCVYRFTMTGVAHNIITISPTLGATLTHWSISSPVSHTTTWEGRPLYVIFHSVATYTEEFEPFQFNLTLNVPPSLQSSPVLDLSHHSHRLYHPGQYSREYSALVLAMPDYFNIASIMTFRNNYVF